MTREFLSLPYEIRCEIYRYLLVSGDEIDLSFFAFGVKLNLSTNILRTCTISHEARSVLYGENKFKLTWLPPTISLKPFIDRVGQVNLTYFKQLRVRIPSSHGSQNPPDAFVRDIEDIEAMIPKCVGLRTIEIELGNPEYIAPSDDEFTLLLAKLKDSTRFENVRVKRSEKGRLHLAELDIQREKGSPLSMADSGSTTVSYE